MKWLEDEKTKHRIIGLAVVVSLATIFIPAMMKNSKPALQTHLAVALKLPPKPQIHEVKIVDEKALFQTIQVSKIEAPKVVEETQQAQVIAEPLRSDRVSTHARIAKAQESPLNAESIATQPISVKSQEIATTKPQVQKPPPNKLANAERPSAVKSSNKKDVYVLQLASFSKLENAKALVERLRVKGYQAVFSKVTTARSVYYKVCIGPSPDKLEVMKLKTLLAKTMQLNGFLVNTKVS